MNENGGTLRMIYDSGTDASIVVGETFLSFLEKVVHDDARDAVKESAERILSKALRHGAASTGLVVGRVQSGKTLSYEAVVALARDNGFSLVVVVSGISNPLLSQGVSRLKQDLSSADPSAWLFLSPGTDGTDYAQFEREVRRVQENWADDQTPIAYKQTAVVFVLKNHTRLGNLVTVLRSVDFSNQRVLFIDDEADQASPNTKVKKRQESPTYFNVKQIREALPSHYYLQYTATPQANLLASIDDVLSPDFVCVLEPGANYVGGPDFFESSRGLVHTISETDLQLGADPNGPPPDSFRRAVALFLVGAAHVVACQKPTARSMLVHPARGIESHKWFVKWAERIVAKWRDLYEHREQDFPTSMWVEFESAWRELKETFEDLKDLETCWNELRVVLRNLDIREVNASAGKTPVIEFDPRRFYLLVGGQAIDRGFTVEGLTVTYMPRGAGTFVADTIQQRARFFGYKRPYLGLCRVFLDPEVREAYEAYVRSEREMLRDLREVEAEGTSLHDWLRRFLVEGKMKPTRSNVIGRDLTRVSLDDTWIRVTRRFTPDAPSAREAMERVNDLVRVDRWRDWGHGHLETSIELSELIDIISATQSPAVLAEPRNVRLLDELRRKLVDGEHPEVRIFQMRAGRVAQRTRTPRGDIQVFEGRNAGYEGDSNVFDHDADINVQLHLIEERAAQSSAPEGDSMHIVIRMHGAASTWLMET